MKTSGFVFCLLGAALLLFSCVSNDTAKPETQTPNGASVDSTEPAGMKEGAQEVFAVPDDLYKKTFSEIETLIERLDEAIKEKNYEEWITYLSREYVDFTSDPQFLQEASQSPMLQKHALKTLKDYFLYVVAPSHAQASTLARLDFIDETHVKAITIVRGESVILYLLVKTNDRWMVGTW